jgi:perosamine synthetase
LISKIKLFDPFIDNLEISACEKVLKSHRWASGAGLEYVTKFEQDFQKYVNSKTCIAVNSGTSALNLALSLLNIKNKEVILPSMTFVSTAHAIMINGGKPIFVDINPKTLCIDENKIEEKITKKTAAILPVHFGGLSCNLNKISKISKNFNLPIIEDAAHASGSSYKKNRIGHHGMAVCFSFHPVKNLAMPNGGLISINHKDYKKIRNQLLSRRWCGISERKNFTYNVDEVGSNYYMNELSAAIGLVQLKKLDKMNKSRKKIAKQYFEKLEIDEKMPYDSECSYHLYWIMVKNRRKFMKNMQESGIETGIHYRPIHTMKLYQNNQKLPITEKAGNHIVSIPIHPNLNSLDVERIIKRINQFSNL